MKKRDIIIVTICIATALICMALTFWGNYKNEGVLSPDAFYGVLATFIGICATIIVGFQIASFVKIHETERQIKEVQRERDKMNEEKEELFSNIQSIRVLLSNALAGLSRNANNDFDRISIMIMAICCDKEMMDSKVVLSRHNTLINSIKRSSPESVAKAANYVHNFKKVEIRKDLEDYIEIMKLHIEVIDILEKAANKEEQNNKAKATK